MGASNSQSSKYEGFYNSVNRVSSSVITRVSNSTNQFQTADAKVTHITRRSIQICATTLTISADAGIVANTLVQNKTEMKAELVTAIMNELKIQIEKDQEAKNEFLAMGRNEQKDETTVWANFEAEVDAAVNMAITNTLTQDLEASSRITIVIEDSFIFGGKCKYNAKALIESVTTSVTESVMDVLIKNDIVNETESNFKLKQKAKNAGLDLSLFLVMIFLVAVVIFMVLGGVAQNKILMVLIVGLVFAWWLFR